MQQYLYLSLIPEALILSNLTPSLFGKYLAIGDKKLTRGPACFFAIDPEFESAEFPLEQARKRCNPHPDGSPRRSTYVSVYGVLAKIPLSAIGKLYLTTSDGLTLELEASSAKPTEQPGFHLYQEMCPVHPQVASPLAPEAFAKYITDTNQPISLPRIVFCEQRLDGLAADPEKSSAGNLPYKDINHLRECLTSLKYNDTKMTKIVLRNLNRDLIYPVVSSGFYVGDPSGCLYYPFPSESDLENVHHRWWASATSVSRF